MRIHVVSLPHTNTMREYSWCAYTTKVRRFCDMMTGQGHQVYLYAGQENEAAVHEHIPCTTATEGVPAFEPDHPLFENMAGQVVPALMNRAEDRDLLCLIGGRAQEPIARMMPHLTTVEFGVGYAGIFSKFRVFESYAWMHAVYGSYATPANVMSTHGQFYDTVIPNYFDMDDFPAGDGAGYLLYIGRLIEGKGLEIVREIKERTNMPMIIAGSGDRSLVPDGAKYVGTVGPKYRAELMGRAAATLVPTLYLEPFGGVAAESMLCGTPVITTDWGAFTETVVPGRDGWRCRDMGEFVWAARHADQLNRQDIRKHAMERFDMRNVAWLYDAYFSRILSLWDDGWYTTNERAPQSV